jgi:hypothetical protein
VRNIRYLLLLIAAAMLCAGVEAWAEESTPKPAAAEKITVVMKVEPNEVRNYKLSVQMKGHTAPDPSAKPIDVEATYSMQMQHKYGRREGDGLLPLEIVALDVQATVDGEKFALPATEFPKLTLLIDHSWKIDSTFGLAGTRYAGQSPGLNYANLVMLFFIPNVDKPHAISESWQRKLKVPGFPDECSVTTTFKSVDSKDGAKTVNVHQDYVWTGQKVENGAIANSKAAVDSVLSLDTGKLLSSHAECKVLFQKSASAQQDSTGEQANTKIDMLLDK